MAAACSSIDGEVPLITSSVAGRGASTAEASAGNFLSSWSACSVGGGGDGDGGIIAMVLVAYDPLN